MNPKQLAGEASVQLIKEGMSIGLGTGTTVYYMTRKLAEMIAGGFRHGKIISTSKKTTELAMELNIPLSDFDEVDTLDLTIDGADEVDPYFNGIKGGGGALLREKIVATNSKQNIWVVDQCKTVTYLGKFPLPVEVIQFGSRQVIRKLEKMGCNPALRMQGNTPFVTDQGNYIVDLHMGRIQDPFQLERDVNALSGVVETGLFLGVVDVVVKATDEHVQVIHKTDIGGW